MPAAVVADEQTAGRGRRGKTWLGEGGVAVTFAFASTGLPAGHVGLVAAVLVRRALGDGVEVKWPNDLLLGGGKVAGLLCERVGGVDLIGVGVNVLVAPAVDGVPTARVGGRRLDVLRRLGDALAAYPRVASWGEVAGEYRRHLAWRGRAVTLGGRVGTLEGVDDEGRLVVGGAAVGEGTVRLWSAPEPADCSPPA